MTSAKEIIKSNLYMEDGLGSIDYNQWVDEILQVLSDNGILLVDAGKIEAEIKRLELDLNERKKEPFIFPMRMVDIEDDIQKLEEIKQCKYAPDE